MSKATTRPASHFLSLPPPLAPHTIRSSPTGAGKVLRDIFKHSKGMSRGDREAATGILKGSMRDNYTEHGVDEMVEDEAASRRQQEVHGIRYGLRGEATVAVMEWWQAGREAHKSHQGDHEDDSDTDKRARPNSSAKARMPPPIAPDMPVPCILAADPYTAQAFHTRTGLYCHPLSFRDIAEGKLPEIASKPVGAPKSNNSSVTPSPESSMRGHGHSPPADELQVIEMVICSFALHLVEKPSELFALLWELSTKARWLVILAPHKRPEIKDGWGWCKWDVDTWSECRMSDPVGELLEDRVHCRVYRSLNT
ncbi:hypothetical protein ONZ51_g282 [Trametes cubensis]|uniref:Uncharacterized protein n=1 Tax=Trametes cubensis TaxID=1111947 RepID=A0AAD7U4H7_9APHY|nr:hypothetical protein ONZ51_g282 [Trametes cubensis]